MRGFVQTRFGTPGGNCFETAVASIIEDEALATEYWGDGDDEGGDDHWYMRCIERLSERGYSIVFWRAGQGDVPQGYAVAGGISSTGTRHSVVVLDGGLAHDPHPRNSGLASVDQWFLIYCPLREEGK